MKPPSQPDHQTQFRGKARYYHRTGQSSQRSWDDWVEGAGGLKRGRKNWLVIVSSLIGLIVLVAITIGLTVELM
jgi:hypothetical protein